MAASYLRGKSCNIPIGDEVECWGQVEGFGSLIVVQITAYFAFTATIVLYLHVIRTGASSPRSYAEYLSAATRCQSHISAMAEKGSLSERYCLVLEELRLETLRQAKLINPSLTDLGGTESDLTGNGTHLSMATGGTPTTNGSQIDLSGETIIDFNGILNTEFSASSGWGQFVSMVSSGIGNSDFFLGHDSL